MTHVKAEVRAEALSQRQLAFETVDAAPAIDRLVAVIEASEARIVAGYIPMRGEMSPLAAMEYLCRSRQVCVPVIVSRAAPLGFREWRPGAPLTDGVFGIPVPDHDVPIVPDTLIVPMLAFDDHGYRLGYGGGYYDRTLQELRAGGRVKAIGLAYGAQRVARLPRDAHDQPLDVVVTETVTLRLGARR